MTSQFRWPVLGFVALAALVVVEGVALGVLTLRARWQASAEGTTVERGRRVAERLGCFGCHGPGGTAGIPNPGAKAGNVPTWSDGSWMMFYENEAGLRSWILDGHTPGHAPEPAARRSALLAMPAFRGRLSDGELGDLVAYVAAVSGFAELEGQAAAGREAAQHLGCFGCHGPEGRGKVNDPGSLKGYIPGWDGADYTDLVQSPAEFRQWVSHGVCDRLRDNPAARRFLDGEVIHMPAFGAHASEADLAALLAYVDWVRAHPRSGSAARSR